MIRQSLMIIKLVPHTIGIWGPLESLLGVPGEILDFTKDPVALK